MRRRLLFAKLLFIGLLWSAAAYSQTSVTGQVKDEAGAPLAGVSVMVKGGKKAVTTDGNGSFTIDAAMGATLTISYVGFFDKEVKVDGPTLNIALAKNGRQLDEVVITALGIKREKKALT